MKTDYNSTYVRLTPNIIDHLDFRFWCRIMDNPVTKANCNWYGPLDVFVRTHEGTDEPDDCWEYETFVIEAIGWCRLRNNLDDLIPNFDPDFLLTAELDESDDTYWYTLDVREAFISEPAGQVFREALFRAKLKA